MTTNLFFFRDSKRKHHRLLTWVCLKMVSTPLYPMVLLIIIPMKNGYFIGNINPTFSDKPTWEWVNVLRPKTVLMLRCFK